jgi:hypothetical protein
MAHTHTPAHESHLDDGVVYQVCECGASRILRRDYPEPPWHTCAACTQPWGRDDAAA